MEKAVEKHRRSFREKEDSVTGINTNGAQQGIHTAHACGISGCEAPKMRGKKKDGCLCTNQKHACLLGLVTLCTCLEIKHRIGHCCHRLLALRITGLSERVRAAG
jgi:hypothetical protein